MLSAVRLPHQPPAWLTPERIAAAAAVFGSAQVTLQVLAGDSWTMQIALTLVVGLHVVAAANLATRRGTTVADVEAGAIRWIPILGALCAMSLVLVQGTISAGPVGALAVAAFGIPIAILGFLASLPIVLAAAPLALVAATGRRHPSHEAPVRALVGAGVWLLAVDALLVAYDDRLSLLALAPGALMVVLGAIWLMRRARFVRRVRAGTDRRFVIVGVDFDARAAGLLPYRPLSRPSIVEALAAVAPPVGGVYRGEADRVVPLCLLGRAAP